ncbi:MAG TPA: hypothetical protein VFR76_03305, partial [Verrucomicrobiae bacterium]|nr:hypothetical protein [Verrucomicrobiae bacterium]
VEQRILGVQMKMDKVCVRHAFKLPRDVKSRQGRDVHRVRLIVAVTDREDWERRHPYRRGSLFTDPPAGMLALPGTAPLSANICRVWLSNPWCADSSDKKRAGRRFMVELPECEFDG